MRATKTVLSFQFSVTEAKGVFFYSHWISYAIIQSILVSATELRVEKYKEENNPVILDGHKQQTKCSRTETSSHYQTVVVQRKEEQATESHKESHREADVWELLS